MKITKIFIRVFILRVIGNFLLLSAIAGVFLTFAPAIQAEIIYRYDVYKGTTYYVAENTPTNGPKEFTNLLNIPDKNAVAITPIDSDFGIVIPKIGANSKIVPNVDPGDSKAYLESLKYGVAHAAGSVYPGQTGNSFLFAHSVGNFWEVNRWNAVFYLLRELNPGDEVDVFYQGRRYIYIVYDKKVVDPSETGYLETQTNFPMLTLQTCWPPGTTLKRLLVFARLKT